MATDNEITWQTLPMLKRYPIIAGAMSGLAMRLVFSGDGGSEFSPMVAAFIFGAPIAVGMVTVYMAERSRRRSWSYYFVAPFMANMLFVAGTLLLLIEGAVCAIVILPMFFVIGGLGGLFMGLLCRLTDWPRPVIRCAAALPIAAALILTMLPVSSDVGVVVRSITIDARPEVVWRHLNDIDAISEDDMKGAVARWIGVPMPRSGTTRVTDDGLVRTSRWGKQVHFDEVIEDWQPNRFVRWTYRFSPDSFPRRALDDHVVIGGHYFNLIDTSFSLEPRANGTSTYLTTRVRYRIATQFNLYAGWVAQLLIGNLNENGLRLYKWRSERSQGATLKSASP